MIKLAHPNVVYIYDKFSDLDNLYFVMECCSNGNLQSYIENNGHLKSGFLISALTQLINAVNYCHQHHIVHGDIKPSNILMSENGYLKLSDFGLSCMNINRQTNNRVGSLEFMASEILNINKAYDPFLSDIFSSSITIYFIVTGELPYDSNKDIIPQIVRGVEIDSTMVPQQFLPMLRSLLDKDPSKRQSLQS